MTAAAPLLESAAVLMSVCLVELEKWTEPVAVTGQVVGYQELLG